MDKPGDVEQPKTPQAEQDVAVAREPEQKGDFTLEELLRAHRRGEYQGGPDEKGGL